MVGHTCSTSCVHRSGWLLYSDNFILFAIYLSNSTNPTRKYMLRSHTLWHIEYYFINYYSYSGRAVWTTVVTPSTSICWARWCTRRACCWPSPCWPSSRGTYGTTTARRCTSAWPSAVRHRCAWVGPWPGCGPRSRVTKTGVWRWAWALRRRSFCSSCSCPRGGNWPPWAGTVYTTKTS